MRYAFANELSAEREPEPPGAAAPQDQLLPAASAEEYQRWREQALAEESVLAFVAPRGVGPTAWTAAEPKRTHLRRRFQLLGQTVDGMRVWDIRRALEALRSVKGLQGLPVWVRGEEQMAVNALYAALFETEVARLELSRLPRSHREGPDYLNVLRILDLPQAVAMASETRQVRLRETDPGAWEYPAAVARRLGWAAGHFRCTAAGVDPGD
jgi:hypothetical protein